MSFTLNKNIIFMESMLFMNNSLDKLVKKLNDFKYLIGEISGKHF